jgi:hypothetical protein
MTTKRRWRRLSVTGLGLALLGSVGCQTYIPGMSLTLPSGRYLEHPPQYIRPDDDFPLSRELATQEANNIAAAGAAVPGAIGPVPLGVVPGVPAQNIPGAAGGPVPGPAAPGMPLAPPGGAAPGVPLPPAGGPAPGPGAMPGR